jgi:DNA helicase MCM8
MAMAMVKFSKESDNAVIERFLDSTQIIVRFTHLQPRMEMMQIKTGLVGKLLTIKGHVVKARPKRLRVATADFACLKCGVSQTHAFDRGQYSIPKSCRADDCRSRSFTLLRSTARYMDVQEIRLQEAQEENIAHAGRSPRQIEVELTHDLVDACRPGDIVLVAARVDAINTAIVAGQMGKRAKETSTYKLCK